MKKGCLIALLAFVLLIVAAVAVLGVAYARASRQFGLAEAPAISHETVATGNTVLRVVFKPETISPLLAQLIPAEQIPPSLAKMGYAPDKWLPYILPREGAILAAPDMANNKLNLTFFVNEKRGGPFIVDLLNNRTDIKAQNPLNNIPGVTWDGQGATLAERGALELRGSMAIPDTVEPAILKSWKPTPPVEPLRIEGAHTLEAVMDNRNGNILAVYGALMAAQGRDWEVLLKDPNVGAMVSGVLPDILDIRAAADLIDFDTATVNLRVDATAEKGPGLEFMVKMVWPNVLEAAAQQGITVKGEPLWDQQKGALLIDLTLSGFRPALERAVGRSLPGAAAAETAKN